MSSLLLFRLQHSNRLCWGGDRTSDPFPSISGFFISGFFTILHCQRSTISSSFKSFFSENLKTKTLNWIWMSDWFIQIRNLDFTLEKKEVFLFTFFIFIIPLFSESISKANRVVVDSCCSTIGRTLRLSCTSTRWTDSIKGRFTIVNFNSK